MTARPLRARVRAKERPVRREAGMLRSFLAFGLVLSILAAGAPPAQAQQRPDWIGQGLPQTLVVCQGSELGLTALSLLHEP